MNDLIKIEDSNILAVFSTENGLDPVIEAVRAEVEAHAHGDMTVKKNRDAAKSLAAKVAKVKTRVDALGKELVAEWKQKSKLVDLERKRMRDTLDELRDMAKAPAVAWENAESDRVKAITDAIDAMRIKFISDLSLDELCKCRESLLANQTGFCSGFFAEFTQEAESVYASSLSQVEAAIELVKLREAEQARIEAERIERERIEREAEIERAKAAAVEAEKARAELERKRIEREKIAAEERAKLEAERAKIAAKQAEQDRINDAKRAEAEKAAAVKAEADRIERESKAKADAERREIEARKAQREYVAKILGDIKADIIAASGIDNDTAIKIVKAIKSGSVRHVNVVF